MKHSIVCVYVSAILVSKFISTCVIIPREKEGKARNDRDGASACTKLQDRYEVTCFKKFGSELRNHVCERMLDFSNFDFLEII